MTASQRSLDNLSGFIARTVCAEAAPVETFSSVRSDRAAPSQALSPRSTDAYSK